MRIKLITSIILICISYISIAQITFDANGLNQIVYDTTLDNDIMLGNFDVDGLKNAKVFKRSFEEEKNYIPNMDMFMPGDNSINDMDITIVMASWCPDSQREVPRMIKVLEALDYPMDVLKVIAVNRHKKVPNIDLSAMQIKYVPTFIFYKDGEELGRIVEMPKQSLEIDIINILNKQ